MFTTKMTLYTVQVYDNVKGVSSNVFFISHTSEEHRDEELKSMSNEHEATYLVALCNYLVLQGYSPSQVVKRPPYIPVADPGRLDHNRPSCYPGRKAGNNCFLGYSRISLHTVRYTREGRHFSMCPCVTWRRRVST